MGWGSDDEKVLGTQPHEMCVIDTGRGNEQ